MVRRKAEKANTNTKHKYDTENKAFMTNSIRLQQLPSLQWNPIFEAKTEVFQLANRYK